MLINVRKKFLQKAAENGSMTAKIELYNECKDKTADIDFHEAGRLYLEIIAKYPPKQAMEMLHPELEVEKLNNKQIELAYLESVLAAARYNFNYDHFFNCVLWAKKGLDLFAMFTQGMSDVEVEQFQNGTDIFNELHKHYSTNLQYFYTEEYASFTLDWENDYQF